MKTQTKALVVGSMTGFVGILSPATVLATDGDCYAVTRFDATTTFDGVSPLIVRYLAENEGSLNSKEEADAFGHLKQKAFSLVGKGAALFNKNGGQCVAEPCPEPEPNGDLEQFRIMTTLDGTIITGEGHHNSNNESNNASPDEPGAHMGLDVQFVRIVNGTFPIDSIAPDTIPPFAIGPITLECTSTESNATPESWVCNVKAEFQEKFVSPVFALTLPITLQKVDPLQVEACSVFQDTGGALPIDGPPEPPPPTTTTLPGPTTTTLPGPTTTTLPGPTTTTLPGPTTTTLPGPTTTTLPSP